MNVYRPMIKKLASSKIFWQHLSLKLMWEGLRNFCYVRAHLWNERIPIFVSGEESHFPTLFKEMKMLWIVEISLFHTLY